MKEIDVLIVGQGIVGTCLAFECYRRNLSFLVLDDGQQNSSKVSSGIINPITGRNFLLSWKYKSLQQQFLDSYQYIEGVLADSFLLPARIIRLLPDIRAENDWALKKDEYEHYLSSDIENPYQLYLPNKNDQFIFIKGYRLRIREMLIKSRDFFTQKDSFRNARMDYQDLIVGKTSVSYKDLIAKSLVFCQGWQAVENPFFPNHELKPNKGEVLQMTVKDLRADEILKYSNFLVPLGGSAFWFGSQNSWQFEDANPSAQAKKHLLQRLLSDYRFDYEIVDHLAAIRPSTQDRRPRVLHHSMYPHIHSVNGMGTKGMSIAPLVVKGFVDSFLL